MGDRKMKNAKNRWGEREDALHWFAGRRSERGEARGEGKEGWKKGEHRGKTPNLLGIEDEIQIREEKRGGQHRREDRTKVSKKDPRWGMLYNKEHRGGTSGARGRGGVGRKNSEKKKRRLLVKNRRTATLRRGGKIHG